MAENQMSATKDAARKTSDFFCKTCQSWKAIERASKRVREGLVTYEMCLDCSAEYKKKYSQDNKDVINKRQRDAYTKAEIKNSRKNGILFRVYGTTLEKWEEQFSLQGKMCAICGTDTPGGRGWCTDHNHTSKEVRGILCTHCNFLLGHCKESPEILLQAFGYLCKYGGGSEEFLREFYKTKGATA